MVSRRIGACLLVLALNCVSLHAQQPQEIANKFIALKKSASSESDWQRWREFVVPNQTDLKWKQTPWLPTFGEGIVLAAKDDKPILLWTMNGHPLGCT